MTSCSTTAVWLGMNNYKSVPSIQHFSQKCLRPLTAAWVTSFPVLLLVYGVFALSCLRYNEALGIKRSTVWEDLQNEVERTIQGLLQLHMEENPSSGSLLRVFPPFRCPHWSVVNAAPMIPVTSHKKWRNLMMESFSLNRHLMIENVMLTERGKESRCLGASCAA